MYAASTIHTEKEYPQDPSFVPHESLVHFVDYYLKRGKPYEQILKTAKMLARQAETQCVDPCTVFEYGAKYEPKKFESDLQHFSAWKRAGFVPLSVTPEVQ